MDQKDYKDIHLLFNYHFDLLKDSNKKPNFPDIVFNHKKCIKCGKCERICPIQRIEIKEKGPIIRKNAIDCIFCGECFHNCTNEAIDFAINKFEKFFKMIKKGKKPFRFEKPDSIVFP